MPPKRADSTAALSQLEKRIYQQVHSAPGHTLPGGDLSAQIDDVPIEEQLLAINSLLKKSLFNAQKGPSGIQYVAVSRDEASMLGGMDANERIIYNHIKDARNEGIWTKMIKARTNLHQTIITRCLKTLEQKQLVKSVKSVKYPTRKIYMLYDLTPSIELSGGPWYTDNELDTGFIHELSMACLRYIQSRSWPKEGRSSALYPATHTAELPTASCVHTYLKNARLTDTQLEQEHVVALLDLLIYDKEIEKIPMLPGAGGVRAGVKRGGDQSDSDSSDSDTLSRSRRSHKHRKQKGASLHSDSESSASEEVQTAEKEVHEEPAEEAIDDDEEYTPAHVPYVYRAVKSTLPPIGTDAPPDGVPLNIGWFQGSVNFDDDNQAVKTE
ncbi:34-kDa subunit of RNA polymerase III (C) [Malassezia cuniculi]|uniref:34-kDa subunit of RNA polymerase III (C) n=1 Tax=Malassezia cuniculi TaxID=948313 RepID=A0AAF0J880_9BASI|nr:34-kDa subunit of RNA polymerase III (C) [Malassezia cuniculi]